MKFAAIVVTVLIVAAFAAHFLLGNPGYVHISFRGYVIEMSVPTLVVLAALLVFGIWLIRRLIQAPRLLGEAAGRYRANRAGARLTRGMIEVAEGNFSRGEKLLARAASTSDAPLFNYLQAARAAHLQGQDGRRDEWLKLAYEQTPEAANAVLLTQAELQLDRNQYEQALATLRRIEENTRDHGYALALLGRLYYRLHDWDNLAAMLPRLKKHSRVKQETIDKWQVRVHRERFASAADGAEVLQEWQRVEKHLRKNIDLLDGYYINLMRVGLHEKAEKDLVAALKAEWRGPLVRLYGLVEGPDGTELWGKARSYLETVLSLRPTPEAYQVYGRLLNQLGETDAAADAFREGLGMVADTPSLDIPRLESDRS